jgi:hypothetical protein
VGGSAFSRGKGRGGTHFSAREKKNPENKGNVVQFRGSEGSKIAQARLLGPF